MGLCLVTLGMLPQRHSTVYGAEDVQKFVNALQQNGYSDLGVYYLEQQKELGKLPEAMAASYDFQLAKMLVGTFGLILDMQERMKEYDRAIGLFEKFIKEKPNDPNTAEAILILPTVCLDRANTYMQLSKLPNISEAEKKQYEEKARADLNKTVAFLDEQVKRTLEEAKKLDPKSENEEIKKKYADSVAQLNLIRFSKADATYELARTFPEGSKERNEQLDSASKQYAFFWRVYAESGLFIAYQGRLREAQVLMELKKYKKDGSTTDGAITILTDFINLMKGMTDQPATLDLFMKACGSYVECFTVEANKPDDVQKTYLDAVYTKWKELSRADSELAKTPDGLKLQIQLVRYWERLIKEDPNSEASKKLDKAIREMVKPFARWKDLPYYEEEMKELTKLYNPEAAAMKETSITFENYQETKKYKDLQVFVDNQWHLFTELQSSYTAQSDPAEKAKMLEEIRALAKKLIPVYQTLEGLKLQMLSDVASEQILLRHRYCRAYLYFYAEQMQEAIILLDILARKYPASQYAESSLNLELQLYPGLLDTETRFAKNAGKTPDEIEEYVGCNLEGMGKAIDLKTRRLADSENPDNEKVKKEIANSLASLCTAYVRVGNIDKAKEYLEKISDTSDARGDAEVSVGFALWKMYVSYIRADEDQKPFSKEQADKYRTEAMQFLSGGVSRLKKLVDGGAPVTERIVSATITLCQILTQTGDNVKTLEWLNDPKIGPYALYKAASPVIANYKQPILNCALQAFVAENNSDEAEKVMNDLEKIAGEGGDGESEERLTMIYVKLGRELEDSLKQLIAEENTEAVAKVQKGFEMFLARIKDRDAGNTFGSLMWVAQTYVSLADGIGGKRDGMVVSAAAKKYYEQAAETYIDVGRRCKENPEFSGQTDPVKQQNLEKVLLQRVAFCYARQQEFDKALQCYAQLLKENPNRLVLQIEAAETFWQWALTTEEKAERLALIKKTRVGDFKFQNPTNNKTENAVWGWGRLAKMLAQYAPVETPNKEYRAYYFLSQLRFAETSLARAQAGEEKEKNLTSAFNVINRIFQLYDDMGGETLEGEEYRNKYDRVLKEIQDLRGEPKRGVAALVRDVKEPEKQTKSWSVDELEEEELRRSEEKSRLADEEERARRAMMVEKKEADPMTIYIAWGVGGFLLLVVLFMITRRQKTLADKIRQADISKTTLTEVPIVSMDAPQKVVLEGVGEETADAGEAINMFASMGIGDKPVVFSKDAEENASPLAFDFGAASESTPKPASKPAAKKPAAKKPAESAEKGSSSEETPPTVKKPATKPEGAVSGEKKPVSKPAVKKTAEGEEKPVVKRPAAKKPTSEGAEKPIIKRPGTASIPPKPAEKDAGEKPAEKKPAEGSSEKKPAEKKVVRIVKPVKPAEKKPEGKSAEKPAEKKPEKKPVEENPFNIPGDKPEDEGGIDLGLKL
ncbi:MAG: tetratricopeptide repeat protein [Planctomycetia bacterium]|nr:tetratricopeptide repeat protein [Planctomycetia bacterium]